MRTTHIKYHTKDQMAEGVYHILRYSDFSPAAKLAVIDDVCWKWSEFEGKVKNSKYWTEDAESRFEETGSIKNLIHEHIVLRKIIKELLLDMETPSYEKVFKILDSFCVGVIVTKEEDAILNKSGFRQ